MKRILFLMMIVGVWLPSVHAMERSLKVFYLANGSCYLNADNTFTYTYATVDGAGKLIQSDINKFEKGFNKKLNVQHILLQYAFHRIIALSQEGVCLGIRNGHMSIKEFGSFVSLTDVSKTTLGLENLIKINGSQNLSTLLKDYRTFEDTEKDPIIISLTIVLEQQKEKQETSEELV